MSPESNVTAAEDLISCNSWINCTSSISTTDKDHCQPDSITRGSTKIPVLINLFFIIIFGSIGNTLTLISIPYCLIRYTKEFNSLRNMTTLLILHLSFCDLVYCLFGLPLFFELYYKGFFDHSDQMCRVWAAGRHLVVNANFLTMAAISLNRSVGVCLRFSDR